MRARGFSLIELIVVVGLVGLMAATIMPRVLNVRDAAKSRETGAKLLAAVETGRALARSRGERIVVGLDPTGGQVSLADANDGEKDRFDSKISISGPFTVSSIERTETTGTSVDAASGETLGVFFEDGTAEPATAELTLGGQSRTLRVDADGTVTLGTDLQPAAEREKWAAGDLENRA